MSAILLAIFEDHGSAERVRTEFVRDGFPTDRVELTASCEPGRAALVPAASDHDRFLRYFRALLNDETERPYAEFLADRVEHGAATVTVHPRGPVETLRAAEILGVARPVHVVQHDLANQKLEHAAARHDKAWIRSFWVETQHDSHCIYCRLFERPIH
jgi:hypothetical protein